MSNNERVYTREEIKSALDQSLWSFGQRREVDLIMAETLANKLGLKLAPEKPELPRRLLGYNSTMFGPETWHKENGLNYQGDELTAIKAEARRCYNAVRECLEWIEQDESKSNDWIRLQTVLRILHEGGRA